MSKTTIAVLAGGNSAEREISLKSAVTVYQHLDETRYDKYIIELNGADFVEQASGQRLDKNDFSFQLNDQKITFELVFLIIHGHPAENGSIQGYFDLLGIPCTGCDYFVSAITFNKQVCKDYLRGFNIPMAPSQLLRRNYSVDWPTLEALPMPLFVKPNKNGSSYGASKVSEATELRKAVELAFKYDDEVIVEGYLEGEEYSNGVFRMGNEIITLPITQLISHNDFFDYKAKYEHQSEEVTPAPLSPSLTQECQALSKHIYECINAKGIIRVDYILVDDVFHFLEVNTIPGMSAQSIVPQQANIHGISTTALLEAVVQEALSNTSTL